METGTSIKKQGFGYGQNKGTWKTFDNGKTWEYIADTKLEQTTIGNVTVLKEPDGIYCKVVGENAVKVLDEIEAKLISFENDFYLISDDDIKTSSDGKNWEVKVSGNFKNVNSTGRCVGDDGIYDLHTGSYYSNKYLEVDGTENDEMIDILLLYAINNIFLPEISSSVVGSPYFSEGKYYSSDLRQQKFALGEDDIYKYYDFSSLINWQEDVGMFPFEGITFKDLVGDTSVKSSSETFTINTDKRVEKAILYVNNFYRERKEELLYAIADEVKDVEPDSRFINYINNAEYDSEQEKINALETYSEYVLAAKGASLEIYNKYLEATHYLDDYQARVVIKTSIYEAARQVATKVRGRIADTSKEAHIKNMKLRVKLDDITWNYDRALLKVYTVYQKYIQKNVFRISEGGDKNIIRVAALNYRTELRGELLEYINNKINSVSLVDILNKHYSYKIRELNFYLENSGTTMPDLNIPDDFEDFYLDSFVMKLRYYLDNIKPNFFENDPNYSELSEEEQRRAMSYLNEIFEMFKTRVIDYFAFLRKKGKLHFTINSMLISLIGTEKKPSWEKEFARLDQILKDSIVRVFVSEEDKI